MYFIILGFYDSVREQKLSQLKKNSRKLFSFLFVIMVLLMKKALPILEVLLMLYLLKKISKTYQHWVSII